MQTAWLLTTSENTLCILPLGFQHGVNYVIIDKTERLRLHEHEVVVLRISCIYLKGLINSSLCRFAIGLYPDLQSLLTLWKRTLMGTIWCSSYEFSCQSAWVQILGPVPIGTVTLSK